MIRLFALLLVMALGMPSAGAPPAIAAAAAGATSTSGTAAALARSSAPATPTGLKRTAKRAVTTSYSARWEAVHVLGLSSRAATAIDKAVNAEIAGQVNGFRANASAYPPEAGGLPYTFDEHTTLIRSVPGIVGIRIQTDQFLGGAHGTPYTIAFDADAATGRRIRIGEVIRTASFPDLAEAARLALEEQIDPDLWDFIAAGTEPRASNFSVWFATPAGLRFVFQAYQVAPYAVGQPEITLPWDEVAPWIRSAAPYAIRVAAGLVR